MAFSTRLFAPHRAITASPNQTLLWPQPHSVSIPREMSWAITLIPTAPCTDSWRLVARMMIAEVRLYSRATSRIFNFGINALEVYEREDPVLEKEHCNENQELFLDLRNRHFGNHAVVQRWRRLRDSGYLWRYGR